MIMPFVRQVITAIRASNWLPLIDQRRDLMMSTELEGDSNHSSN